MLLFGLLFLGKVNKKKYFIEVPFVNLNRKNIKKSITAEHENIFFTSLFDIHIP